MAANLKLLAEHGVTLAIGSDDPSDTSLKELESLRGLGLFDDGALLRMWLQATPRPIFPGRKIGSLEEGFEASFLVLDGNPLEDMQNVRKMRARFKRGVRVEP